MGPRELDDTNVGSGGAASSDEKPTTTTISTIAVRAAPHTTIVIAMLKVKFLCATYFNSNK